MDKVSNKKGKFKTAGENLKEGFSNLVSKFKNNKNKKMDDAELYAKQFPMEALKNRAKQKLGKGVKTPTKKPELVSSKFQRNQDGTQKKITIPSRLKEIEREDAMDNIKKVAQGLKHGGKAKPYGMKYGGKPYGMKRGGKPKGSICRGMGAATRGGKYTAT